MNIQENKIKKNSKQKDNKLTAEVFFRRIRWLFSSSGVLALAFEHFLAMVPATILVPLMVNNKVGMTVIDISLVLFTSGLGTLIFTLLSKGKIPAYLGSSFAYIGLTIYLIQDQTKSGVSPELAYTYVAWSYLFSGIILIALSWLYKKPGIEKTMSFLLPPSVIGPAISLIGLELADTAVVDSGFDLTNGLVDKNAAIVAITTLCVIVLFSLMQRKILKNASIIIGIIAGYIVYCIIGAPKIELNSLEFFSIPNFQFPILSIPPNLPSLIIAVIPATFIVFTENIGRVTVINQMVNNSEHENNLFTPYSVRNMGTSVMAHGFATAISALLGSVPNTIYAENIAIMSIHKSKAKRDDPDKVVQTLIKPFSWVPLFLAAIIAIIFSFIGVLQSFIVGIPKPVIGGMELFLFGIISAPGIQLLVDQHVDYKKISNQIITASVLISGISGLAIEIGAVEIKGMGLGFIVGVSLNIIVKTLKWLGNISDSISFSEILIECLSALPVEDNKFKILNIQTPTEKSNLSKTAPSTSNIDNNKLQLESIFNSIPLSELYKALIGTITFVEVNSVQISAEYVRNTIKYSKQISIGIITEKEIIDFIKLNETANGLFLIMNKNLLDDDAIKKNLNDYPDAIDIDSDGKMELLYVDVEKNIPIRKIKKLIQSISEKYHV